MPAWTVRLNDTPDYVEYKLGKRYHIAVFEHLYANTWRAEIYTSTTSRIWVDAWANQGVPHGWVFLTNRQRQLDFTHGPVWNAYRTIEITPTII